MEEQIAEEYKKNTEHRVTNLLSRVSVWHLVIFGVIGLIVYSMTKNQTDPKYNYIIYGVLIVIIAVLYFKPTKEKKLLPDYVVKQIAQEALNRKVREGKEFAFDSKVFVKPQCHLRYSDDLAEGFSGPIAWDVEFEELVHGTQYKRDGFVSLHPFDGVITAIFFTPFGFNPRESQNVKIIPVGVVQGTMKTSEFGQPKP